MKETFQHARGRKVVSRASAQDLGSVSDFLLDSSRTSIAALVVGRGRKARLVDWQHVTGFGPDAVMVADDEAVREPVDDREERACDGRLDLVGKRALTDSGNELGKVDDVEFESDDGTLLALRVEERELPPAALLGVGSYAAVVSAEHARD